MGRLGLFGLALAIVLFTGLMGCGGSGTPPAEERPGLKARQDLQKEKAQQKYMKPDEK